jgi:hypothetical protein
MRRSAASSPRRWDRNGQVISSLMAWPTAQANAAGACES